MKAQLFTDIRFDEVLPQAFSARFPIFEYGQGENGHPLKNSWMTQARKSRIFL
jgi:hypothetical protein